MKRTRLLRHTALKAKPPLKRSGRIRPKKKPSKVKKDGRIVLKGEDMTALRLTVFERSGGLCEIPRFGTRCCKYAPWSGHEMRAGQLAHWPPKGMGNAKGSDTPETTLWACPSCHDWLDNRNQKVCPPKPPKETS